MSRWFTRLRLRVRSLFYGSTVEQELDEEIRYHLEREIEERVNAGLAPDEARRAARRSMGAIAQRMDECRDARRVNVVAHLIQDLRFAVRQLVKSPGFACTAILMLALGTAGNVAIFGFVDAALIRPLPYADQSRLVLVYGTHVRNPGRGGVSYLDYIDFRDRTRAFSSIDAFDVRAGHTLTTPEGAERVSGLTVTSGFFRTLGVTPMLGRDFRADEEGPSAPATVMLSYSSWQTRVGASQNVVGQTVTLGAEPHVVIGVLPRGFHFTLAGPAEFWVTIRKSNYCRDRRSCRSLQAFARLADGVSLETANADLASVTGQLREQYPESNRDLGATVVPLREVMLGDVRPILLVLLSGAGLLLLIAGINVVSLLLARSDSRTREIAVRGALGASSARLVRQFATEALLLVVAGSAFGLMLAAWGMRFLLSLLSEDMLGRMPYLLDVGLNGRLVAFTCAVALVAAVVFALTPVLRVSVSARSAGLREGSRGSAGTTWRRFGAYLVIAELATAVVLLVSAGLLGKSLYLLLRVDTGLNPDQLATLSVSPPPGTPTLTEANLKQWQLQGVALARQVADRVAALPGVQAVGYADQLPLSGSGAPSSVFWVAGRPEQEQRVEDHPVRRVSAGYFTALQARLLRGRYFTEEEVSAQRRVLIINQTTALRYFPGEDPIGKSIVFGRPGGAEPSPARLIVGVIADIKDVSPETPARPAAYVPFDQNGFALVVRTPLAGDALFPSLADAIQQTRPGLVTSPRLTTMTERMNRLPSAHLHRSSSWVVGGFAAMAFLLGVVGLYGVVAYSVAQRTREIGVRMALGAQRRSVYRLVLGEAAWLVGAGTALGIICAVAAATLMRRLLFGVQSWDPTTLVAVAAVLVVSALLASYIPARRAASVNPIEVLRAE